MAFLRPLTPDSHLVLVDGSGYIFRAYHALPPLTRRSDGMPMGAVSGYCNMLWKLIADMRDGEKATHLAVIFDAKGPTFRNDIYDQYKAHRPPAPEDLVPQFSLVREATRAFGLPSVELAGFEADDLIATYARHAEGVGANTTIISSDKDLMQLVSDRISLYDTMKSRRLGPAEVMEKFGVGPDKVIEVQALAGDSADNVPGVPGIGVKTAALLINEYGSLDELLARAGEIKQNKRRENLIEFADLARVSRELVTLRTDVPMPEDPEEFGSEEPKPAPLISFLEEMEFATFTRKVRQMLCTDGEHDEASAAADASEIDRSAYVCVQDIDTLKDWVALAKAARVVAVDTETDALSATAAGLVGISLAISPGEACYIPLSHGAAGDLLSTTPDQIPMDEAIAILKPLLEDPAILKIGQNIKYDLGVLHRYGIDITSFDDTMLLSYVEDGTLHGHGMDELSKLHLGHAPVPFKEVAGVGKAQISFDQIDLKPATEYAAEDADVTLRLWQILKPRLTSTKMHTVYETLERPMPQVLSTMELHGVKVDRTALGTLSGDFGQRMAQFEGQAKRLAGRSFNLSSPKQLGEILFDEQGLPGGKRTKTGAWKTDAKVLDELAAAGHELPQVLLKWRQLQKLKSTYTDALAKAINPKTGRVHTSFMLASTSTGRLSSSDPNLMNIPIRTEEGRKIRSAFIAEPGYLLLSADYSQIELRVLAHIARLDTLQEAFANGVDIHAMTASEMFGVAVEGMDPMVRRQAKAINFGIIYGISAFGLANQLGIGRSEAAAYIKAYFEKFPGIAEYMEAAKAEAREAGFVKTLFGRHCTVPGINDKNPARRAFAERQAINAPIQGSAADIMRRAMIRMPDALANSGLDARMLLQVHDELVFEVREDQADDLAALAGDIMQNACAPTLELSVPLVVDSGAGLNWDVAH
ncbi:MAG: DNA polymerase I [Robiginitomaculum sp.]|nr:MAG: DNA polymerase I [Robiginitomaculum sp.]